MNTVLKYTGSKFRIADWIVSMIPDHCVYLEPYFGSGAVFFNKQKSRIETINDVDGKVVNFFRMVRERPQELSEAVLLTPYARQEYDRSFSDDGACDALEQARRFAVRCWMSYSGGNRYHNGFRSGQQGNSPNPARAWNKLPEAIMLASMRLKDVQIECLPALDLIERYNTKDVFIYADPPYLNSTRKNYLYHYEMTEKDHKELLEILLRHPGKIMISGYENDLYDEMLAGWRKESRITQAENGVKRIETLWMNYEIGQLSFFFPSQP